MNDIKELFVAADGKYKSLRLTKQEINNYFKGNRFETPKPIIAPITEFSIDKTKVIKSFRYIYSDTFIDTSTIIKMMIPKIVRVEVTKEYYQELCDRVEKIDSKDAVITYDSICGIPLSIVDSFDNWDWQDKMNGYKMIYERHNI